MRNGLVRLTFIVALVTLAGGPAYGQGGVTAPLTGVVVDTSGGVIPGADVVVKNNATGGEFTAVTDQNGTFTIPALNPGTYTVTISLMGFKTAVLNNVVINAGVPASVRAVLEIGALEETIVVQGASEIVQTQSTAVAATLDTNQIATLPTTSRNALDFIVNLPGVQTPGGSRDSIVQGLPQNTINITVDGMNVQDNYLKSTDGFFARMSPRLDAVEEVTVTTAAQGADAGGQGAVQIRFVTRSGSNEYRGSVYHYFRHHKLNSNTWFNNREGIPKAETIQNQPGVRLGGPIVIPGLWDGHNKGFFFVNYEEFRQPTNVTRNRIVLHPRAQEGWFRYTVTVGGQPQVREVNLLALAAANGQVSTVDPLVAKVLGDIRAAMQTKGTITDLADPLVQRYTFDNKQRAHNRYPTVRVDFNLSEKHRLTGTFNYNHILSTPDTLNGRDPNFPGFPVQGPQDSHRYTTSNWLRSTLTPNLVNEFRVGATGGPTYFSNNINPSMWQGTDFGHQGGFLLNFNGACCGTGQALTNASSGTGISAREASTKVIEDTLSWIKGGHSVRMGFSWTQADLWLMNQTNVPTINFGVVTGDPAEGLFTTANFPGASSTNLTNARALYAILTGRVSSITANARIDEKTNEYVFLGKGMQRGRLRELDLFAQDSWRLHPKLTVNYGLRYVVQFPFHALNDSYSTATLADAWGVSGLAPGCKASDPRPESCNLFKPGVLAGKKPEFILLSKGQRAYNVDWNNIAPSVGLAWRPAAESGFLRSLLGQEGDTVVRGGWSRSYTREGMSNFSDVFGSNPGVLITADRSLALGNLGPLPLLLRQPDRLGPPDFPKTRQYPMTEVVTGDLNIFDPDLQVPYADSWSVGIQRALGRNMAVEVRYIGTRSRDLWTTYDYNEINILENGFLEEFKLAQANLLANVTAGRGANFRYYGPGTGTYPLPIFLAYFSGVPASLAGDPARYTSTLFASTTFVNPLARLNPQPFTAADALDGDATRRANALAAGLPPNFLVANPDLLGGANVTGNGGYTRFNGMEVELRRRLSQGLQFQASYAYGKAYESNRYSFRKPRIALLNVGGEGGVTHAFKANWVYELPFGQGRRFASNAGAVVDRIIGGWYFAGTARIQSGRLLDFGNVRLVGMTKKDVEKMFKLREFPQPFTDGTGPVRLYMLPLDVIENTIRAFSVSATSTTGYGALGPPTGRYFAPANGPDCIEIAPGFGDCGIRSLVVTGPALYRFDLSVVKQVRVKGRTNIEFRAEMLNAFNKPYFTPVTGIGTAVTGYEVTGADSGRIVQLVSRVTW
jgi:hypothetical protein